MFKSTFQNSYQKPFSKEGAVAAEDWWLSGGISAGDCVAAYQPKGAASLAASYLNLNNPGTNDAAQGVSPTINGDGWVFNGSTQYLETGIIPVSNWSMFIRFSELPLSAINYMVCGQRKSSNDGLFLFPRNTSAQFSYAYGTRAVIAGTGRASGVMGVSGSGCYWDGVSDGVTTSATITIQAEDIYIGAFNSSGSPSLFAPCKVQAFCVYSTTITTAQVLALSNAMNLL